MAELIGYTREKGMNAIQLLYELASDQKVKEIESQTGCKLSVNVKLTFKEGII